MRYQKGAALIITLLLISVFASLIFVTSRISSSEFRQTTSLEDSELAFLAAQSGIESGLLLFRYDKNTELSEPHMSPESEEFYRYNLTDARQEPNHDNNLLDSSKSYFDLQIWHRNAGNVENLVSKECNDFESSEELCIKDGSKDVIPALHEGDIVEYDVSDIGNLRFDTPVFIPGSGTGSKKMEVLLISKNDQSSRLINFDTPPPASELIFNVQNYEKMRIKTYNGSLRNLTITSTNPTTVNFDSRYTTISSTGYYGKAKRTLEVRVDRATGSLLSPFDFNILSSNITSNVPVPSSLACDKYYPIKISNSTGAILQNYQIKINIPSIPGIDKLRNIRFFSDKHEPLYFWTDAPDSNTGDVWINVDKINRGTDQTTIFLQYQNCKAAIPTMSGKDTFELFDDFTNIGYSKTIWDNSAVVDSVVKSGYAMFQDNNHFCANNPNLFLRLTSIKPFSGNYSVFTKIIDYALDFRYMIGFDQSYYIYNDDMFRLMGFYLNDVLQVPPQGQPARRDDFENKVTQYGSLPTKTTITYPSHTYSVNRSVNTLNKARIGVCDTQLRVNYIYITKASNTEPTAVIIK